MRSTATISLKPRPVGRFSSSIVPPPTNYSYPRQFTRYLLPIVDCATSTVVCNLVSARCSGDDLLAWKEDAGLVERCPFLFRCFRWLINDAARKFIYFSLWNIWDDSIYREGVTLKRSIIVKIKGACCFCAQRNSGIEKIVDGGMHSSKSLRLNNRRCLVIVREFLLNLFHGVITPWALIRNKVKRKVAIRLAFGNIQ